MAWLRWLGRGALVLLGVLVIANIGGFIYESIAEQQDAKNFPPPGQIVNIGARKLHISCTGAGDAPTIIIISGGGTASVADYALQDRIAKFARVCTFDRPGLGWSPPAKRALKLSDHVADLRTLLIKAGVKGPYVLAPELFGGLIALAYARKYPDDVAGLVMIDAAEPLNWYEGTATLMKRQGGGQSPLAAILTKVGVVRLIAPSQLKKLGWNNFTPHEQGQLIAIFSRPNPGRSEALDVFKSAAPEDSAAPPAGALGDRPLIVIRHGKPFTGPMAIYEPGWGAAQDRLAQLSTNSQMMVAENTGHEIAQLNPDLVAGAVRGMTEEIRIRRAAPNIPELK